MNYTFDSIRVVMVNTTEPGNIGAAARAMKNMRLSKLYLVNPVGYPSAVATARASGADDVLANALVCKSLREALSGAYLVIGASARQRSIKWRQMDVVSTCNEIQKVSANHQESAIVFGTENSGLSNEELDYCQVLMIIPSNPDYSSLNVASAVQVFAYQNYVVNSKTQFENNSNELASFNDLEIFYTHLFQILKHIKYFDDGRPKILLIRRLRRLFSKAMLEKEEVAIFRGILNNIQPFKKS